MCNHHKMGSFYIALNSGSPASEFSNRLNKSITLHGEYEVAVNSITKYYETENQERVFVRMPRSIIQPYTTQTNYPKLEFETAKGIFDGYIASTTPYVVYQEWSKVDNYAFITVGNNKSPHYPIFQDSFYIEEDLKETFTVGPYKGVSFVFSYLASKRVFQIAVACPNVAGGIKIGF